MNTTPTQFGPADELNVLWQEYKYRHEHIWKLLGQLTFTAVVLAVLPYVEEDVTAMLRSWIVIAPLLAAILLLFGLTVIYNELDSLDIIKTRYRKRRFELLKVDQEGNSSFRCLVSTYLIVLVGLAACNVFVVWSVWIPAVLAMQPLQTGS